ncbi:MAG: type II secretion system F family protein [Actinomycetota bacterium]|nr:MAG: type II secretion system F family protein [Actinomycetota bacterium]
MRGALGSPWLLAGGLAAIFLGVVVAVLVVAGITVRRRQIARSMAAVEVRRSAPDARLRGTDSPFADRVVGPAFDRLVLIGQRFTAEDQAARLRRRLDLAGNPAGWDVDRIVAYKVLGLLVLGLLGVVIPLLLGRATWAVVLGIGLAVLGYYLPNMALYQAAYNRSEQIQRDLPDSLDLLTISVEAGLGFDAALAQVARNTEGPLAEELFRVLQEMQIGTGRMAALRAMGDRTDVADLRTFVTAIVQADVFGIPIANVLRVQAREMRVKRQQRAEEAAQKVPVKILFPLIFCILPALFVVILGPAAITIAESFGGL